MKIDFAEEAQWLREQIWSCPYPDELEEETQLIASKLQEAWRQGRASVGAAVRAELEAAERELKAATKALRFKGFEEAAAQSEAAWKRIAAFRVTLPVGADVGTATPEQIEAAVISVITDDD